MFSLKEVLDQFTPALAVEQIQSVTWDRFCPRLGMGRAGASVLAILQFTAIPPFGNYGTPRFQDLLLRDNL